MMKSFKYLSAALLTAMALCLCSCGGDDPVKPDEPDKPEEKKETVSLPVVSDIQAKLDYADKDFVVLQAGKRNFIKLVK